MSTIYDIAEKCNVSSATVSRALKDDPRISYKTKELVKRVAKELNYHPNAIAKSLKLGKSSTIGVITNDLSTFAVPNIVAGIEMIANSYNYDLILGNTSNQRDKEQVYINVLKQKQVEGIIFVGTWAELDRNYNFLNVGVPCVAINRHYENDKVCTVNHDDIHVSYLATEYLIKKSYTRIAFINGPMDEVSPPGRLAGYKKAILNYQLLFKKEWTISGDWHFDTGYLAGKRYLQGNIIPNAIVAANDLIAIGAIKAIDEMGLRVPDDIAVIGCDNRTISENYKPRLTTIKLPLVEMGQTAARNLFMQLLNNQKMQSSILKSSIIIRESA